MASSLRQAGVSGTMDQLRAKVYLALLTGQPITALTGRETSIGGSSAGAGPGGSGHGEPVPGTCGHGPLGTVNLTMPLATWLGLSDAPGHAAGYGPLDAADSRDLAARLAGQRGGRWCITLTGEGGRPVAHGCARTGRGPSGRSRPPPRRPPRSGGSPGGSPGGGGSPRRVALLRAGRLVSASGRPTSANGRPVSANGWPVSANGWPASLSGGWRRVTAAICGSHAPTGRRPACGT
jgi:hypothetical protein